MQRPRVAGKEIVSPPGPAPVGHSPTGASTFAARVYTFPRLRPRSGAGIFIASSRYRSVPSSGLLITATHSDLFKEPLMYRKIMVPLDGSPFSEEALPLAVEVAHRTGAELRLVHVLVPIFGKAIVELERGANEELDALARRVREESGVEVSAERLMGDAVAQLAGYVKREGIDLVVMATHGWGGLQRAWLGSVTDALIREVEVPILAFRPHGTEVIRIDGKAKEHVLIPLDGSELAEAVLDEAILVAGADARFTLLRVVPLPIPGDPMMGSIGPGVVEDVVESLRAEAERYLTGVAERLEGRVAQVKSVILVEIQPATAILLYAADHDVDLIALATHGRRGLQRWALGSVADKVLRGGTVPVLLIRPEARQ